MESGEKWLSSTAGHPVRIAHLSDLHVGRRRSDAEALRHCADRLRREDVDWVVVSGDITHRGLRREWATFEEAFSPFAAEGSLVTVPGNHDCLGEDVSGLIMPEGRVHRVRRDGVTMIRVNSNGPHNRRWLNAHGWLGEEDIDRVRRELDAVPASDLVVLVVHHHPLPLPEDLLSEKVISWLGWPFTSELLLGEALLAELRGRCDLVLHGHRHTPNGLRLFAQDGRPLTVVNAGSTSELGAFRCFSLQEGGRAPGIRWIEAGGVPAAKTRAPMSVNIQTWDMGLVLG
jgi:3',5'-cyclic AMP phosphodiesterase CpdA